jgi:hypothetical protein
MALLNLVTVALSTVAQAGPLTLTPERFVPVVPGAVAVVVIYNPADGNLSVESNGRDMSSVELLSSAGLFDPSKVNEDVLVGPFDLINPGKFFKLVPPPGLASLDIGPILPSGLSADALLADLQIDGSLVACHSCNAGAFLYMVPVPEPGGLALVACGLLGMLWLRR